MNVRPVEAVLLHEEGRTEVTNLADHFNFRNISIFIFFF